MAKLVVVPNNMRSKASKSLAETLSDKLGYKVWRVLESRVRRRIPFKLQAGLNKTTQLTLFVAAGVPCPEYTLSRQQAELWIGGGDVVFCRTLTRASEGRGIVVAETVEQLVDAPLYTKYFKKKEEYRVHVLDGQVVDVQIKRKRRGFEDVRNTKIRNLSNGYVFCRDGILEPTSLRQMAISAVSCLGYSLGAVDMAYNVKKDLLVVLEVNACPGMQGTTLENYANAIVSKLKEGRS